MPITAVLPPPTPPVPVMTLSLVLVHVLGEAADVLGIEVLDHVIVGDGYFSMKEHGML